MAGRGTFPLLRERRADRIQLSAVVLPYRYGRRAANVVQTRFSCLLSFCPTATAVVQRTSCRQDSVVCCRSALPLRPSCSERRADTIQLSAVVLPYRYGRRAANVVQTRFSCLLSFCPTATAVVQRTSRRDDSVVCRRSVILAHCSSHSAEHTT